ncbi:MAG: class I SAM-dependent methyltransferase [Bacteroidetes bacterium]|nr:class I SAM-dependent methyltransferase [Bacteroidota bacterium]
MKKVLKNSYTKVLQPFRNGSPKTLQSLKPTLTSALFKKYRNDTMVPEKNFKINLELAYHYLKNVPGDIVECGVWKGGMSAALSEVLGNDRKYFLFDSFEGLPAVKPIDGANAKKWQENVTGEYYFDNCKASIDDADETMKKSNCHYQLFKGWFEDTLPGFHPENGIALLRLDADWYDSTLQCLTYLYPKVVTHGMVLIDDYYTWDGCSRAIHHYLSERNSTARIRHVGDVCYIIKTDESE